MRTRKFLCGLLSAVLFVSVGMISYADSRKSYEFNFYGTDDKKGTFSLSIKNDQKVHQNKTMDGNVIFSMDLSSSLTNLIEYDFDLPNGGIISFALDGYGKKDNSFVIFDNGGRLIGYTNILKAVDRRGKEVPSNISISNNKIRQVFGNNLNMNDVSIEFEIHTLQTTAERANSFNDSFSKSEWITRADGVSLSLYPIYAFPTNALMYAAWDTVVAKHGGDNQWSNESGMKDQFHCHNDFASAKRPWNLEPWRPDVGYLATVAAGCNPQ